MPGKVYPLTQMPKPATLMDLDYSSETSEAQCNRPASQQPLDDVDMAETTNITPQTPSQQGTPTLAADPILNSVLKSIASDDYFHDGSEQGDGLQVNGDDFPTDIHNTVAHPYDMLALPERKKSPLPPPLSSHSNDEETNVHVLRCAPYRQLFFKKALIHPKSSTQSTIPVSSLVQQLDHTVTHVARVLSRHPMPLALYHMYYAFGRALAVELQKISDQEEYICNFHYKSPVTVQDKIFIFDSEKDLETWTYREVDEVEAEVDKVLGSPPHGTPRLISDVSTPLDHAPQEDTSNVLEDIATLNLAEKSNPLRQSARLKRVHSRSANIPTRLPKKNRTVTPPPSSSEPLQPGSSEDDEDHSPQHPRSKPAQQDHPSQADNTRGSTRFPKRVPVHKRAAVHARSQQDDQSSDNATSIPNPEYSEDGDTDGSPSIRPRPLPKTTHAPEHNAELLNPPAAKTAARHFPFQAVVIPVQAQATDSDVPTRRVDYAAKCDSILKDIQEITGLPSTLPHVQEGDSFYSYFTSMPKFHTSSWTCWTIISPGWQKLFGSTTIDTHLRGGLEAYELIHIWVSRIRAHARWGSGDESFMYNALGNLHRAYASRVDPNPSSVTHQPLFRLPSQALLSSPVPSPPPPTTLAPSALPTASLQTARSPPNPRNQKPYSEQLDSLIARVEVLCQQPSQVPLGSLEDEWAKFFTKPYTSPPSAANSDDPLWTHLDLQLNSIIGVDTCPNLLRKGPLGADGLLRGWLVTARATPQWAENEDRVLYTKLKVVEHLLQEATTRFTPNHSEPPPAGLQVSSSHNAARASAQPVPTLGPHNGTTFEVDPSFVAPPEADDGNNTNDTLVPDHSPKEATPAPALPSPAIQSPHLLHSQTDTNNDPPHLPNHGAQLPETPKTTNTTLRETRTSNSALVTPLQPIASRVLCVFTPGHEYDVELGCKSISGSRFDPDDCAAFYAATVAVLKLRGQSPNPVAFCPDERLPRHEPFRYPPKLRLHQWLAKPANAGVFVPSTEAPWCRSDLFDFPSIDSDQLPPPAEKGNKGKAQSYMWDVLRAFHAPKHTFMERATKYLLAAIGLVGAETAPQPQPIDIPSDYLINAATHDALDCSNHYKMKRRQNDNLNKASIAENACLSEITALVNKVYALIEALAYVRSFHLHNLYRADMESNRGLTADLDFQTITKKFNLGATEETLAPLVAFLSSGVKGLMIYSGDKRLLSPLKLIHFMLIIRKIHPDQPIKEPIWKRTQSFILDLIQRALFPSGFDNEDPSSPGTSWAQVECPKMSLARAIHLDFVHFCMHRHENPDSEYLTAPPFELPEVLGLQIQDDRARRASTVAP